MKVIHPINLKNLTFDKIFLPDRIDITFLHRFITVKYNFYVKKE